MDHLCDSACTTKHMICWGKPASTKVVVTKALWTDGTMMTNTESLCQILGGLRNRSFNMTQSHWKIIPSWLHGKKEVGTESLGNLSLNAEGIQGPLNQRSDCIEAQQKCNRLYDEHTAMSLETETTLPLHNKSGNSLINNLKASKNTIID